ncbi:MAG TPA: arginine--tRNA ligase [Candidatus Thalassarchaeaceae archaeon]|nr:MAG TPA: arginine--tRNA ligase [Candidatus Poseidoniales archaeon]HII34919.1 arginine--tRNA ligase [Candidatus Thalassarchaeaceae archaeon]
MRDLIEVCAPLILDSISELEISKEDMSNLIGPSTVGSMADIAIPCHSLSRILKKSPVEVSEHISGLISPSLQGLALTSSMNGFVNLKADPEWLASKTMGLLSDNMLGVKKDSPRKIIVDYSAPNVAKEMHVGHLRSTVIGDAIVRMLRFKGHEVIRENHIGDWGTPFGMLIEHLIDLGENSFTSDKAISDFDQFYKEARVKFNHDDLFAERARSRVVLLQAEDSDTLRLWKVLVDVSTAYFNEVYEMLDVLLDDDDIMGESAYRHLLPTVVERLRESGMLEESEGASVVYLGGKWVNREGAPFPVIIRKGDGGYNYSTSDLACIIDRVERISCDELMYVVGTPQKQHFEMVFEVASRAGFMDERHTATHINFGSVLDSNGKMLKSRAGQSAKLVDLLKESIIRADSAISEKNPELTGEDKARISKMIGIGAVKYADLSTDRSKDYIFDWDKMLSFEGNTAPYLQYSHARISRIFSLSPVSRESLRNSNIQLSTVEEEVLAKCIVNFAESLDKSIYSSHPHKLCTHIHATSSAFATFYEACPILKSEDDQIMISRLALCDLTARVISTGLDLLGIMSPEMM